MSHPFILKLRRGVPLTAADETALSVALRVRELLGAHTALFREGDAPGGFMVLLQGLACRYKNLRDGRRQIVALLVPGDTGDLYAPLFAEMDHGLATLGPCVVAHVPRGVVRGWMEESPSIRQAMEWAALVDEATQREWLVNLGARNAAERTAHLFCELFARLQAVDAAGPGRFALPMTQEELSQTLGLSAVHVNRMLQRLRRDGLATCAQGQVTIPDAKRLQSFSGFRPNYLHLAAHPEAVAG